ncbi:Anion-transporting ATPase, ArsA/GET3 family [Friedmanniella luteola]|uniref:Anion-transporting ATPase, ArsA/GET3 family n=1 Tax=Friedmanniella luteola TaxID=546871 RepID=A0A1H1LFI5_9ACTN|nr:ArsA-related P-loop ATPase [Friedmanniella luteola]SDR72795.1 Anion-transporting ATPase, ArsA/GET3 family [Friedmanniella luteola]
MVPRTRTAAATATPAPFLDVDAVIADRRTEIIICCGSGGVGKTTTSAAIALRAAEAGRRVVVLTIDPARRLAQSLGLGELDNTPRPVRGLDPAAGGSLDAMMLDMKRTFDDVVLDHSTPQRAQEILSNPFYVALSSSFAGTQEYMAMEKLGQLHTQSGVDGRWDLIVVDTPPARSALDFLDAPEHLSSLLDGRFIRLLLAPARGPLRLMSVGFTLVSTVMNKVVGGQLIKDLQTFVAACEALFGGFRNRAQETYRLLSSRHTTFVVVATPQRDALREAAYFVDRLTEEQMPLAGLVINRTHVSGLDVSAERALSLAEDLPETAEVEVEALRRHADLMRVVESEQQLLHRFSGARPQVPRTLVETLPTDVTDVATLRTVGDLLAKQD